ncbi:MAG TPA: hypothetical protein VFX89_05735 [Gammaproteobacteria bacterium]|nr:hypothetical protein [Gammaproteobacteria bacterium]
MHLRLWFLAAFALCALGVSPSADAQPVAETANQDKPDEMIVRGRKSAFALQHEADLALEHVFDVFNQYNSDDDFDIHCSLKRVIGTRTKKQVCSPVYADKATAKAGRELTRRIQAECGNQICERGLFSGQGQWQSALADLGVMNQRLEAEMKRLALEKPEVAKAIDEFNAKERAYREQRGRKKD